LGPFDAQDVSFPPIHFSELDEKGSTAVFSDVGCSIRGPGSQGIGEALWNANGLVMKEHEPGLANAEAETPTEGCLDCQMGHVTPLVAQEVEKGCVTGIRLESMPSGYPVVDKSWVDGLLPCEIPFEGESELLAVREWAERVWEDVECGYEKGGGIFEDVWLETGCYEQLSVLNFEKDNCDKKNSSAYHLEGEKLGGLGEKNADEPVIYEFPSDNGSPFPPNNAPAQTSAPYVTEIPHDPPNEPLAVVECEAKIYPNAEHWLAGHAITFDNMEGHETVQDVELATPGAPESTAAAAADVGDVENVVLEGENAPDCAAEFVNEGAGMTAIDLEMRCTN